MSISPEPRVASREAAEASRLEQAPALRAEEVPGEAEEEDVGAGELAGSIGRREDLAAQAVDGHDHGEIVAAALVRVTTLAPPGALVPGGWPGARIGVALQTVSAVDWLSAGRARGAA